MPSTRIINSSALTPGASTPWRSRYVLPRWTTSEGRMTSILLVVLGELVGAFGGEEPVGEAVQLFAPAQHSLQLVRRVLDPMVRDAPVGEVVGPDLLRALSRAELGAPHGRLLRLRLLERHLVEAGAQVPHRLLPVLELRS